MLLLLSSNFNLDELSNKSKILCFVIYFDKQQVDSKNVIIILIINRFRIYEAGKDRGFGQSLLHDGQLVFHTPPYSLQSVTLQNASYPVSGVKVTVSQETFHGSKLSTERSKSLIDQNKEFDENLKNRLISSSASPLAGIGERKPLGRRFSYTSMR